MFRHYLGRLKVTAENLGLLFLSNTCVIEPSLEYPVGTEELFIKLLLIRS